MAPRLLSAPAPAQQIEDIDLNFQPVPSLAKIFLAGPDIRFIAILGPIGSTKTTSCLYKMLLLAASQEPSPDGIRRTRFAIVRNTLVSLKQTVLKDALSLFGDIAEWRQQDGMIRIRVADIDSEWLFLSLETPQDQRRLLSLQLSSVYANEAREITFELLMATFSRCGRYPSPMHGGVKCTSPLLLFDSNMGVKGSALYNFLEKDPPPSLLYVHQPSALSPHADWIQFLREGYYEDLMIGARKAWIETHVHAQWSTDLSGEPIFAEVFDEYNHVARRPIRPVRGKLVIGLDPGLNPAALVTQTSESGRLLVLAELHADNMLFGPFIDELLVPLLRSDRFLGLGALIVADPAANTRQATSSTTAYGMLRERGFEVDLASTNDIAPRLNAIEHWLTAMRVAPVASGDLSTSKPAAPNSDPALQFPQFAVPPRDESPIPDQTTPNQTTIVTALLIDPSCTVLIEALAGEYKYKRKPSGELELQPMKKHPTSDVVDCLGYAAIGLTTPRTQRRLLRAGSDASMRTQRTPDKQGWT